MAVTPEEIARRRLQESRDDIEFALDMAKAGNPYAGEPDPRRRQERLQSKSNLTAREAEAVDQEVLRHAEQVGRTTETKLQPEGPETTTRYIRESVPVSPIVPLDSREKVWGGTIDFVSVAFLERGAQTARSVGRVAYKDGKALGSGVLIGERLFLTNHHVIENSSQTNQLCLEFDYERDLFGSLREPTRFDLDSSVFITDPVEGLDFTIVGVGDATSGPETLDGFGCSPLSAARDKHMIGEFANIVQHPRGRFKEVVLRENQLVNRYDDCLHYVADTEPGSSGSPVYNSEWQMIALHHWGGPWIDGYDPNDPASFEINEGIRISSIVRKLRNRLHQIPSQTRLRIHHILDVEGMFVPSGKTLDETKSQSPGVASCENRISVDEQGRATWTIPLEVSVQIPQFAPPEKATSLEPANDAQLTSVSVAESDNLNSRKGYLPNFLDGFMVPLPQLGSKLRKDAAELNCVQPGDNPYELKYQHFSIVMNKRRRLAFFAACMIDGKTSKSISRSSRNVTDLKPTDSGLSEIVRNLDGAEADSWVTDPRLNRNEYSGDEIYKNQMVPGFPNPRSSRRIARMYQKGHLVRRLDPAWGEEHRALEAELDTFHWTNAVPQVGFFNQGRADEDEPGTGRGKLWRAAENYVLRNAVAEDQKVVSFTGPIFRDDDRSYRKIQIPMRFFKVTVWVEDGRLKSLALIVDQGQVIEVWPESLGSAEFVRAGSQEEAFLDAGELDKVRDFLSTIKDVEAATDLDFGEAVRNADVRAGLVEHLVATATDLPFTSDDGPVGPAGGASDAPRTPADKPDDLTQIRGIGPTLQLLLNEHGIFHFHQIAGWSDSERAAIGAVLRFPQRIEKDEWVKQAQALSR